MVMIQCPECANSISSQANSCPNCGFSIYKVAVKKKLKKLKSLCIRMGIVGLFTVIFGYVVWPLIKYLVQG